jgi:uncharacterized protein (DUF849 family)
MTPSLPRIMVAANGARLTTRDHPAVPVTIPALVDTARACQAAGAGGIHFHLRDAGQRHLLDAGLYAEALAELARAAPGLYAQVTTEAAGRYGPEAQAALMDALLPPAASLAPREVAPLGQAALARHLARWRQAGCHLQLILYDAGDVALLRDWQARGLVGAAPAVLLVLGRHAPGQRSDPADLAPLLGALRDVAPQADWAACAFGPAEADCLAEAHRLGGKCRIGFENNTLGEDGRPAPDNAARVAALAARLG